MRVVNFERLRIRLLQGGVAPKYVRRTVQEMQQHLDELYAQEKANGVPEPDARESALNRLGDEDTLVTETVSKKELQALSRRYPKSTFLLLPVVGYFFIAVFSLSVALGGVMEWFSIDFRDNWPAWHFYYSKLQMFFMEYLLAPGIAFYMAMLAVRRNVPLFWPMAGIFIVCFFGLGFETQVSIPDERGRGGITLIWGWPFLPWEYARPPWPQAIEQFVRWIVTMWIAFLIVKNYRPYTIDKAKSES